MVSVWKVVMLSINKQNAVLYYGQAYQQHIHVVGNAGCQLYVAFCPDWGIASAEVKIQPNEKSKLWRMAKIQLTLLSRF